MLIARLALSGVLATEIFQGSLSPVECRSWFQPKSENSVSATEGTSTTFLITSRESCDCFSTLFTQQDRWHFFFFASFSWDLMFTAKFRRHHESQSRREEAKKRKQAALCNLFENVSLLNVNDRSEKVKKKLLRDFLIQQSIFLVSLTLNNSARARRYGASGWVSCTLMRSSTSSAIRWIQRFNIDSENATWAEWWCSRCRSSPGRGKFIFLLIVLTWKCFISKL